MSQAMYQEAVEAIRGGQRERGRDLLTRLLRIDQDKTDYWLWMSAVVETVKEQSFCYHQILRLDPGNHYALQGLRLIGEANAKEPLPDAIYRHRDWRVPQPDEPEGNTLRRLWNKPGTRIATIVVATAVLIGMIALGVYGFDRKQAVVAFRPTKTLGPPPTYTSTPTYVNVRSVVRQSTPTPRITDDMQLWMLLDATYTPTPFYVNTPHPISESYRIGLREFGRNNWLAALNYFTDAARIEADAPDLFYYIGETQRLLGDNRAALHAFEQAISLDSYFAPAYLGRSRVKGELENKYDPLVDLDSAISLDPNYAEAYQAKIEMLIDADDLEGAQDNLSHFVDVMPESALVKLYNSQLAFKSGDYHKALVDARLALQRDQTLLPAYRQLAQAALANNEFNEAYKAAKVYVQYTQDDPVGWVLVAQSQARIPSVQSLVFDEDLGVTSDDLKSAILALDEAEALAMQTPEIYIMRAILLLEQGDGQSAVNELMKARRIDQKSLLVNLGLGRALLEAGRAEDAYAQINSSENLTDDQLELAAILYWRALAGEKAGNQRAANADWRALLALDVDDIPSKWLRLAKSKIATATPSATVTLTPGTLRASPSATTTSVISKTPTRTATP